MGTKHFTIGMAGHIDHGKTSLTKALTEIDTDRLREEKERNISIEPGFAPLTLKESSLAVSIVDVPGHERFIRQMIAGVAGIDLVIITIAADEGVMPQTKEHMDILDLLEVHQAIIVMTKIDRVDEEMIDLVKEDIESNIAQTSFSSAPILKVDSLSEKGIEALRSKIEIVLMSLQPRDAMGEFRLPIDQVFTVKGQGTVVRGTVYDGTVNKEDTLTVLPNQKSCRARQIQVHNHEVEDARAGQRAAINLGGIDREDLKRGDVLVSDHTFPITDTIDVTLTIVDSLSTPIKQRGQVKLHIGTSDVMGRIVFFDRNELLGKSQEVVCQIRLDESVVVRRGDRFILRRPSPVETIGGGWILDPYGEKYRFGQETVRMLEKKRAGTPEERIEDVLDEGKWCTKDDLLQQTGMQEAELDDHLLNMQQRLVKLDSYYSLMRTVQATESKVKKHLHEYHQTYPMRMGMNKPDVLNVAAVPSKVMDRLFEQWEEKNIIHQEGRFISLHEFVPHFPSKWEKRMNHALDSLKQDGLKTEPLETYLSQQGVPLELSAELKSFLLEQGKVIPLDDKHVLSQSVFREAVYQLQNQTADTFTLKEAKDVWGVSRKYLIPLLEAMDEKGVTERVEDKRRWI